MHFENCLATSHPAFRSGNLPACNLPADIHQIMRLIQSKPLSLGPFQWCGRGSCRESCAGIDSHAHGMFTMCLNQTMTERRRISPYSGSKHCPMFCNSRLPSVLLLNPKQYIRLADIQTNSKKRRGGHTIEL